jgi:hypothetical protein
LSEYIIKSEILTISLSKEIEQIFIHLWNLSKFQETSFKTQSVIGEKSAYFSSYWPFKEFLSKTIWFEIEIYWKQLSLIQKFQEYLDRFMFRKVLREKWWFIIQNFMDGRNDWIMLFERWLNSIVDGIISFIWKKKYWRYLLHDSNKKYYWVGGFEIIP